MENMCVVCGAIIPEGRQVCPTCEKAYMDDIPPAAKVAWKRIGELVDGINVQYRSASGDASLCRKLAEEIALQCYIIEVMQK